MSDMYASFSFCFKATLISETEFLDLGILTTLSKNMLCSTFHMDSWMNYVALSLGAVRYLMKVYVDQF